MELTPDFLDRAAGCLLGLAVGDAVGTAVEFLPRGSFEPVTDMVGGGPFRLTPGAWTDDTSMALCLATSLVEVPGFDPRDQMDRYVRWWREGYLSSTGTCFDIGGTVRSALARFEKTGDPMDGAEDPHAAGNGCIMRLAPVPLYFFRDGAAAIRYSGESSRTTHGARECIDACRLLGAILMRALAGLPKEAILQPPFPELGSAPGSSPAPKVLDLANGRWRLKARQEMRGSGYVVDSLEAALWSFHHGTSFEEAVLTAVNLGDDADTTAAVCGQIAGAHYGAGGIPVQWREKLVMADEIEGIALRLVGRSDLRR